MEERSIYSYIEEKGLNDAKEILSRGKERAQALELEILSEAKKEADSIILKAKKQGEDLYKTAITQSEQKFRQRSLNVKKELLDQVFSESSKKLDELKDDEYRNLIVNLLKNEKLSGDETIKVAKKDFDRYIKLFDGKKNKNGEIVLTFFSRLFDNDYQIILSSESAPIIGGLIVEREDYDLDLSFESLLQGIRDNYEPELAKMLFSEGE
ncbi:TPA: hypothetical protein GXZ54_03965 [bacterium]|jgi:vacuolar-type H+-ATPase subunit E/Vma4|nr:hypothetical protein [bacterium]